MIPMRQPASRRPTGRPTVLVFDIGLTHAKTALFDDRGQVRRSVVLPHPTHRSTGGLVEQDPEAWWHAIRSGVATIAQEDPNGLHRVAAISVTGHMHALVLEGADREPLGRAFVLGDRRAVPQATAMAAALGEATIHEITGATMDPSIPAAELRWLADVQPNRRSMARLILGCKDWLRRRLTGDRLTDPIDACATGLYDIRSGRWSMPLLEAARVRLDELPEVVPGPSIAGPLRSDAAARLGLTAGIPVVVGAGDDIEVLGAGLLDPGDALEHLGTTGSILAVTDHPPQSDLALELYPHAVADRWVVGGSTTTAGAAVAWAADVLGFAGPDQLLHAALRSGRTRASPPLFAASLAGERSPIRDPAARGAWLDLELGHDRATLALAVVDGVGLDLARVLAAIDSRIGRIERLHLSGSGTATHRGWVRRRAATYERPIVPLAGAEATSLGAYILAVLGVGMQPDPRVAVERLVRPRQAIEPPDRTDLTAGRLKRLETLRARLRSSDDIGPLTAADWRP